MTPRRPRPHRLRALDRGGTLTVAGIHLTDLPRLHYQREPFGERTLTTVTASTRADGEELLRLAAALDVAPVVAPYPFQAADRALQECRPDQSWAPPSWCAVNEDAPVRAEDGVAALPGLSEGGDRPSVFQVASGRLGTRMRPGREIGREFSVSREPSHFVDEVLQCSSEVVLDPRPRKLFQFPSVHVVSIRLVWMRRGAWSPEQGVPRCDGVPCMCTL